MLQLRPPPPPFMMQRQQPPSTTHPTSPSPSPPNPAQQRIHQMLSTYISTIRREDILPRLNELLQTRCSNASLCNKGEDDIQSYYAKRPELRNYTLGVELDRDLDYTLILEDGTSVTDKGAIRAHFGYNTGMVNEEKGREVIVTTKELLIRAANQSLLADGLAAITGSEEVLLHPNSNSRLHSNEGEGSMNNRMGLILSGPMLSMTSIVEKCHFTVDLQHSKVEAICVVAISIPIEHRRLVLARGILIAHFCPTNQEVGKRMKRTKPRQVHHDNQQHGKQQLQYAMQLVKAHHYPSSITLFDASASLARDEENLIFQDSIANTAPPAVTISGSSSGEEGEEDSTNTNVLRWDVRRPFALFRER